jgi:hypothetical protein
MKIELLEEKLLTAKDTLDKIAVDYKVEFCNLEEQHKFDNLKLGSDNIRRNGGDGSKESKLIEWFFRCNQVYNSLVTRKDELSVVEYTINKNRSIRDIYITINTCSGHKIEDFNRFIKLLAANYPFYYCGTIKKVVFHPYHTENPLNGDYNVSGSYFDSYASIECDNTKLTCRDLLWYTYLTNGANPYNQGYPKLLKFLGVKEDDRYSKYDLSGPVSDEENDHTEELTL